MRYLFFIAAFISLHANAQLKSFIIGVKGDTLNKVDVKNLKQGRWVIHVDDLRGERGYEEEGYFTDDKKEGIWRRFSLAGDLLAIENFRFGFRDGKNIYFNNMGDLMREEYWRAIDPKNPYDTVNVYDVNDPSKVLRKQVVKVEASSYKNGTWTYYNPDNGTIAKTEEWIMDRPKTTATGTNDDLAPINTSGTAKTDKKTVAKPKEVLEFEKKNAGKKKIKIRDGSTGGY